MKFINIINKYFSQDYQSFNFLYKNQWISNMPRYIQVDGVSNFRDLGGYKCNNNCDGSVDHNYDNNNYKGYIRERYIFRCGE